VAGQALAAVPPGNRHDKGVGRTLRQLVSAKMALVAVCRRCKHRRVLFAANYIAQFGEDCLAIELRERLRCSSCRGRMANLHESSR
jgi:hypothetical protein